MIQDISTFTTQFAVIIPIIVGLVQVAKRTGLASRYYPLLSVVLGAVAGFVYVSADTIGVLMGITAGLSASGLFSGARKTIEG